VLSKYESKSGYRATECAGASQAAQRRTPAPSAPRRHGKLHVEPFACAKGKCVPLPFLFPQKYFIFLREPCNFQRLFQLRYGVCWSAAAKPPRLYQRPAHAVNSRPQRKLNFIPMETEMIFKQKRHDFSRLFRLL